MVPPPDIRADEPLSGRRSALAAPPPNRRRRRVQAGGVFAQLVRFVVLVTLMAGVGGALAGYVVYRQVATDLPDYRWLADYQPPQMSRIYAADSRLMAELAAERRVFVPIEAIPPRVAQAFVSAEDQRFREHRGVDPVGIARAVVTNLEQYGSGRRMGGASTITQQVAKNMLVGADRTLARKAREAILAFRIEQALSKDRILEIYLNEIYLGSQAYGVAAAAQTYFNKGLDELTVGETAFLAALPRRQQLQPRPLPEAARARRDWVVDRMAEDGAVSAAEAAAAKAEPWTARPARRTDAIAVGQHFTERCGAS
jgi:penicillin-binding protein 1A